MTEDRMAVLETVRKAISDGDVDFLREGVRVLAEALMEAEVTEVQVGKVAGREPSPLSLLPVQIGERGRGGVLYY